MRLGILTGRGHCSGLNAEVRAVVHTAHGRSKRDVIGYRHGWRGLVDGDAMELSVAGTDALLATGGTALGTARYHPHDHKGAEARVLETLERDRIGALIVVGGDGTLAAADRLADGGVRIIGVPKTIDNDVPGTDRSVGFDTALSIATEAVDRVRTTAESHDRLMVVEVMGHHTGWLAFGAGIAGGAHAILAPESPFDIDEVTGALRRRHRKASFSIVVVAEGAVPIPGSMDFGTAAGPGGSIVAGAVGERVRAELALRTGFESRLVVLGHVQRGGPPTPADRLLASRFGVAAVRAVEEGASGVMTGLTGDEVVTVPLSVGAAGPRGAPSSLVETARALLG